MKDKTSSIAQGPSQDFLLLHQAPLRTHIAAALGLLAVLGLFRLKTLLHFTTAFLGGYEGDAGLYVWLMRSNVENSSNLAWFNTGAFYPYGRTLAWSDNFILPALAAWPALQLGLPLEAVFNLLLLSAGFLNGWFTYRLALRLSGAAAPSFCAGSIFMSFSYLGLQLGHPQLQFFFWIPLGIDFLFAYLQSRTWRHAILTGFSVFLCFLCCVYYSVFLSLALLTLFSAILLAKPRAFSRSDLLRLCAGGFLGLWPLLFFVLPYLDVQRAFGSRQLYEARAFAATALSYLSAPVYSFFYHGTSSWTHAEANLFPGILVLLLSAAAFVRIVEARSLKATARLIAALLAGVCLFSWQGVSDSRLNLLAAVFLWGLLISAAWLIFRMGALERRLGFEIITHRDIMAAFLFLAVVAFALSLGPLSGPGRRPWAPGIFTAFYYLMPGVGALRAISRIGILCIFALIMTTPFALALLQERRRLGVWFLLICLSLSLAENFNSIYPLQPETKPSKVFKLLALPEIRRELAVSTEDVVLSLPLTGSLRSDGSVASWSEFARINVNYMNWAQPLGMPSVNGYSGQRSAFMLDYPRRLSGFPDARSLKALSSIVGLRFIFFVSRLAPAVAPEEMLRRLGNFSSELSVVRQDEDGSLLLEYNPITKLNQDYTLWVPAFPQGTVQLELMSLYKAGSPQEPLYGHIKGQDRPFAVFQLPADGQWNSYHAPLPKTSERCRPLRIYFKGAALTSTYLGRRRFRTY